jgi:hypothetical protein
MRAMTIAFPVSILMGVAAAAQEPNRPPSGQTTQPPAPATGTAVPQAPVGHRQPTQSGLPPAVRKDEAGTTGRREVDPLGPVPSICRNC